MAHKVTDASFETDVLKSDKPVLVDFWAEWCGPCRMLGPIIEGLSEELKDQVKICKMDIDENPNTASGFGIRSIPTMILFIDGKELDRKTGVHEKEAIKEWITPKPA